MTEDPCGGNRKGGEGCSCDPPFVTKDPRPVARYVPKLPAMRWVVLIVAFALLMGLSGWLVLRQDVVSGHGHLSPRLQQQATP